MQKACNKRSRILIKKTAALANVSEHIVYKWMLQGRSREGAAISYNTLVEWSFWTLRFRCLCNPPSPLFLKLHEDAWRFVVRANVARIFYLCYHNSWSRCAFAVLRDAVVAALADDRAWKGTFKMCSSPWLVEEAYSFHSAACNYWNRVLLLRPSYSACCFWMLNL